MTNQDPKERRVPNPIVKLVGVIAALGAVLVVLLALFILPSLKGGANDLAIGITGDPTAVATVVSELEATAPGDYELTQFDSADQIAEAVRDREITGGMVVAPGQIDVVVASAGSTAISGSLVGAAQKVGAATQSEVTVDDVVPLPAKDPTGIGIGGLAFPLVFGGIVPVVAFGSIFGNNHRWKLAGLGGFAVVGGTIVSAVLTFWFGSTEGAFVPVAAAMALGIAALAFPLAGLQMAFGGKGFTIGAVVMMFLGNPLSGMATTGSWLPAGLGDLGQILPPGAAGALVRSVAYFDGAGGLGAGITLAVWVVAGLIAYTVGVKRTRLV